MPQSKKPSYFSKLRYWILVVLIIIFGIITVNDYIKNGFVNRDANKALNQQNNPTEIKLKTANIVFNNEVRITAEIADTDTLRENGLSFRSSFAENTGMLFVFDNFGTPFFWMKDMLIPLDIIWISDNTIVDINSNVPVPNPNTSLNQLPKYSPKENVNYVLEVNAGFCDKNNIKTGDTVLINF